MIMNNKEFLKVLTKNNITRKALSVKLAVTERAIGHWISGRNKPSTMQLFAMAKIFNMQVEDLYYMFKDHVDKKKQGDKKC